MLISSSVSKYSFQSKAEYFSELVLQQQQHVKKQQHHKTKIVDKICRLNYVSLIEMSIFINLNLTYNLPMHFKVLNLRVEILKHSLPETEEHLMGNKISTIKTASSFAVQGFDYLQLLNPEDNCIADWNEILKLSHLKSSEQLHLSNNNLNRVFYRDDGMMHELLNGYELPQKNHKPFQNLHCLLLGSSVDPLNSFPQLGDIRLSDNPVADPGQGGFPRFDLVARLAKVEMLNGSEVSSREKKSRRFGMYVRLVMSKMQGNAKDIQWLHPRFAELKVFHGIEDEKLLVGTAGPQEMSSGLLSITLKCVGASIGEKPSLVGKLKVLCESFFKLKSIKLKLFLKEEGSPLPMLLDDEMATLTDLGIGNESIILVDEES
ncbi:tubulin-folding cofactor E [Pyrus ussuriensis x Pyrus communis]|uniref:Tubulin-folding cofactor E n=1 Tax=Pyrus ussuriensis x Pyrus communis TaxID=2448454 RepID=A0A5N5HLX3_9ROSA|nr:tubulin-folding cofactor E [Pyrus ussuriensis x Pyrus communis]